MKYYLIKAPENHLIYVEGERNREAVCVELTEKELEEIQFSIELKDKEISEWNENKINKKIRKVLE